MLYHVSRNGQMYGPYTIEDLQRYVLSGNVLPTDLAKSDSMPEWLPVHQVLSAAGVGGFAAAPAAYPVPASTATAADPSTYPDPPNLQWGLVLLFNVLTCGLFMAVWNIIVSAWMKRVQPGSQAMIYYIAGYALLLLNSGASFGFIFAMHHHHVYHHHPLAGIIALAGWVVRLIARFTMRANLEEHFNGPEPLGLRLSGVMTFFFGGLYHQYHLNRINEIKNAVRYRRTAL
ncbi:DUF4339 domain-containing protein [Granulicella arctica]|uniref:GYF domain-containing protein n=1 Tax=Granulicella arctica TaxID=940613 RepID=A0A7Y9TJE3_9BACT|nr:DUF4339 domain-containing protein [Granulicella arctica]NYF78192.1 hypothetical protein [Granulicella arctica]